MSADVVQSRILRCGFVLFFLGLITGYVIPHVTTPRLALSSHLAAVQNGMLLIIISLVWPKVSLSSRASSVTFWLLFYGTYMNWGSTLLGSVWGTTRLTPLAGGPGASALKENIIFGLTIPLTIAMVSSIALILWGLRGHARQ